MYFFLIKAQEHTRLVGDLCLCQISTAIIVESHVLYSAIKKDLR